MWPFVPGQSECLPLTRDQPSSATVPVLQGGRPLRYGLSPVANSSSYISHSASFVQSLCFQRNTKEYLLSTSRKKKGGLVSGKKEDS